MIDPTDLTLPALICLSSLAAGFFFGVQMMVWVYWRNEEEKQRIAEHTDEMHA